jgi:hypothetical protein
MKQYDEFSMLIYDELKQTPETPDSDLPTFPFSTFWKTKKYFYYVNNTVTDYPIYTRWALSSPAVSIVDEVTAWRQGKYVTQILCDGFDNICRWIFLLSIYSQNNNALLTNTIVNGSSSFIKPGNSFISTQQLSMKKFSH